MSEPALLFRTEGGFCNRLRAIISAVMWAEDLDRSLEIYWPVEPGHMACRLEDLLEADSIPRLRATHAGYLAGARQVLTVEAMAAAVAASAASADTDIRVESYAEFHPDAEGPRGLVILRQIRIREDLEKAANNLWKDIGGESSWAGSHFRATDHTKCLARYPFTQLVDDITSPSLTKVFFVTDDLEVKEQMIEDFHVVCVNLPVGRMTAEQQICGVIEWLLLQKCGTLMGCKLSSYVVMAARRSGAKKLF